MPQTNHFIGWQDNF